MKNLHILYKADNFCLAIHMDDDDSSSSSSHLRIAIVGPCSSGKSTLGKALLARGYTVRQPAQEHSLVPDMWQRVSKPDLLIYLDVDYEHARQRRPYHDGGLERYQNQTQSLSHARTHCDLYLNTNDLSPEEVQEKTFAFLQEYLAPQPHS